MANANASEARPFFKFIMTSLLVIVALSRGTPRRRGRTRLLRLAAKRLPFRELIRPIRPSILRGFPCSLGRNGKIEQIQAIRTEIGCSHVTKLQSRGLDSWEGWVAPDLNRSAWRGMRHDTTGGVATFHARRDCGCWPHRFGCACPSSAATPAHRPASERGE